jgi:hypothetical protein
MKFNNTELTESTIISTRNHFAQISENCIQGALTNEFHVNDVDQYVSWKSKSKQDYLDEKSDHTFTFLQYAYFLQTGQMVALLK